MSLYQTGPPLYQAAPPRLRGLVKKLIAIAPVSAKRAETLLGVGNHRMIDALFVLALLILPINAFVVTLFLLSSADPTSATAGAVDAMAMLILPP
jgi:hypothetical protein